MAAGTKPSLTLACLTPEVSDTCLLPEVTCTPTSLESFCMHAAETAAPPPPPPPHWLLIKRQAGIRGNIRFYVTLSKRVSFEIFNILSLIKQH